MTALPAFTTRWAASRKGRDRIEERDQTMTPAPLERSAPSLEGAPPTLEAGRLEHIGKRLCLRFVLADTNDEHVRHNVSGVPKSPLTRGDNTPQSALTPGITVVQDEKGSNNSFEGPCFGVQQLKGAISDPIAGAR